MEIHNAKYGVDSPYHLHQEMRPCPFEGDLLQARDVLPLGNPHFLPEESSPVDHVPIEDWGLTLIRCWTAQYKCLVAGPEKCWTSKRLRT